MGEPRDSPEVHLHQTPKAERLRAQPVPCAICAGPVDLERCKIDENGSAVHADCYLQKLSNSPSPSSS